MESNPITPMSNTNQIDPPKSNYVRTGKPQQPTNVILLRLAFEEFETTEFHVIHLTAPSEMFFARALIARKLKNGYVPIAWHWIGRTLSVSVRMI